ncbi:unnamed protein product [Arctogadus glacialis]
MSPLNDERLAGSNSAQFMQLHTEGPGLASAEVRGARWDQGSWLASGLISDRFPPPGFAGRAPSQRHTLLQHANHCRAFGGPPGASAWGPAHRGQLMGASSWGPACGASSWGPAHGGQLMGAVRGAERR